MTLRIVYRKEYDIRIPIPFLQQLHPFDGCKFSKAFQRIQRDSPVQINTLLEAPNQPITHQELAAIHDVDYLNSLSSLSNVLGILELPQTLAWPIAGLRFLVGGLQLQDYLLEPMRWGTAGTILGAELALKYGSAINLSGGYHHAKPTKGEGFCFYADVGLAIHQLRERGLLQSQDRILYIDLDAHHGNGVAQVFREDDRVCIFDMYNTEIYPQDSYTRRRINCNVPLTCGTTTTKYLDLLTQNLSKYVEKLVFDQKPKLAIYNAGTDIFSGDALGQLHVSEEGVLKRDKYVWNLMDQHQIPTLMVLSGGYSEESHHLIAQSVLDRIQQITKIKE